MRDQTSSPFVTGSGLLWNRVRCLPSIFCWFAHRRERVQLRDLSDHALKDCGLSRADVEQEVRKLLR